MPGVRALLPPPPPLPGVTGVRRVGGAFCLDGVRDGVCAGVVRPPEELRRREADWWDRLGTGSMVQLTLSGASQPSEVQRNGMRT